MTSRSSKSESTIEVRWAILDDGSRVFDEIVAEDAHVHLEKMGRNEFSLIIETPHERAWFFIGAKRARVEAREEGRELIHFVPRPAAETP